MRKSVSMQPVGITLKILMNGYTYYLFLRIQLSNKITKDSTLLPNTNHNNMIEQGIKLQGTSSEILNLNASQAS